jgi:lysozyme family protein
MIEIHSTQPHVFLGLVPRETGNLEFHFALHNADEVERPYRRTVCAGKTLTVECHYRYNLK